jgi:hypothetical protein
MKLILGISFFCQHNSTGGGFVILKQISLFDEFLCKLGFFGTSKTSVLKAHECQKSPIYTHERVEYNVFWFDELLKGSKSLKIFKISLTFRFDKW